MAHKFCVNNIVNRAISLELYGNGESDCGFCAKGLVMALINVEFNRSSRTFTAALNMYEQVSELFDVAHAWGTTV